MARIAQKLEFVAMKAIATVRRQMEQRNAGGD
jgi:hypothetical protein